MERLALQAYEEIGDKYGKVTMGPDINFLDKRLPGDGFAQKVIVKKYTEPTDFPRENEKRITVGVLADTAPVRKYHSIWHLELSC